ncbi:hypothetical protein [Mycobacterium sp.]|jgi:hypothetical protein|uniref:hypothetical protein n=1 Tax=Mycobacterium sp. TaxID=1785 RepID=UPI002D39E4BA|nr:hypothetical protein [Mycobacterium sp.]HZA08595.1 hypothetical protein [Mycobacterium sp.]
MIITADDVRRLLAADEPDAVLVLVQGRTEVVPSGLLDSDEFRGALQVATRDELFDRLGSAEPSERELEEQAAALDTAVSELGA